MISKDKKYKTRLGLNVIIYKIWEEFDAINGVAIDDAGRPVVTLDWDLEGRVYKSSEESGNDLIEITPYADFKIDDKVLVWDDGDVNKYKMHFAGISEKTRKPMAWDGRRTSFTETCKVAYENCIKYEENND